CPQEPTLLTDRERDLLSLVPALLESPHYKHVRMLFVLRQEGRPDDDPLVQRQEIILYNRILSQHRALYTPIVAKYGPAMVAFDRDLVDLAYYNEIHNTLIGRELR
ncbi:MAG: hypothetical protein K8L99_15050, partial [Anaerolineae bacterium]|nr:hypothetical protein [Anaerolineae bacterium]